MTDEGYIPDNRPLKIIVPYIIAFTALISVFLTGFCLFSEVGIVYSHLYYIPIILTALFYPKKGVPFAVLLGIIFLFTTFVVSEADYSLIIENLARAAVFIVVAAVISKISYLLREDNLKYKNLMDSSGAAYAILDEKGRVIYLNPAFENMTGYKVRDLKTSNWAKVFDTESSDIALMLYRNSVKGKDNKNEELLIKSRNRSEYNVLSTIKNIPELHITLISLVDITEKKKIENIAAVQKERYKKLFQQSIDGIIIHNTEGVIFNANREALRMTGMDLNEIKNTSLRSIIPPEFPEIYHNAITGDLEKGKIFNLEAWFESRSGEHIDIELRSVMIDSKTKVILTIIRDITTRKKIEKSLEIALKKLNLLSSITRHDIINQIMIAKMNLEFAKEDTSDESVRKFLEKSSFSIDTIQHQIEFNRDYQDMGANPPKWHNIDKLFDKCLKSHHIPPHVEIRKNTMGSEIFADPMLEKVICNLIGNTVMHAGDFSIISISVIEGEHCYKLIYEDNGKGIPEQDKKRIFRPGFGRNQGYGLYLITEILSITGASITENGSENSGARFEITFPEHDVRFP